MSDGNQDTKDLSEQQKTEIEAKQGADLSRRKLAKAGLIAAPIVMSLTSRPVLGNQCSLSGMLSTTYSGPDTVLTCAGRTPGFWKTHPDYWPQHSTPSGGLVYPGKITCVTPIGGGGKLAVGWDPNTPSTLFSEVFGMSRYDGWTMMNLLWATGVDDPYQLGAHTVAAWFNAGRVEFNYGLTPEEVIARFQSVEAGTYPGNELAGSSMPMAEALKVEFQALNERGSLGLDDDYSFLADSRYWLDYDTYQSWVNGDDVSCDKTGDYL